MYLENLSTIKYFLFYKIKFVFKKKNFYFIYLFIYISFKINKFAFIQFIYLK